eukprot:16432517-Heterocapsa_arctica.AAC.1
MMKGRASKVTADGVRQISNDKVRRFWRLSTIATELRVRRLKMYRRWVLRPDRFAQVITAVFANTKLDTYAGKDRLAGALTPWAWQLLADLRALAEHDENFAEWWRLQEGDALA